MVVHLGGLASVVVFYVLILLVGIWAGRKQKSSEKSPDTEEIMLAGRNIGLLVGIFTMTATWVGGAYINGTAEQVFSTGLLACQAPLGYAISLVVGGLLFARPMRNAGYVTMLDPFQRKYGQRMGGLLFIPALLGEVFWSAAILSALGATISVIFTDVSTVASIIISATVVIIYTLFGGLYSVAYTDVVQLGFIFVGLWVTIPFAMQHVGVGDIVATWPEWRGHIEKSQIVEWIDSMLLLVFGGIPWQVYFQRVLSAKTASKAMFLSFYAAIGCIVLAIPPVLIGAIAKSTNWTMTDYDVEKDITSPEATKLILPLVLLHLCPKFVAFIGLGAVSAAVMSSADSSVLSASSMFARNVWKLVFRDQASEREVLLVMRIGILFVGIGAAGIGILVSSIYVLWYLCSDLVYVILFPQLLCVVYVPNSNTYGSLAAYITGFLFRFLIGESSLGIPKFINFGPYIPPKTLCMLISLATTLIISYTAKYVFEKRILPPKFDIFHCLVDIPSEILPLKESTTTEELQYKVIRPTTGQPYLTEPVMMINSSFSESQEVLNSYARN
ncbi:unnamed protein product [Rotaria magnacalcarata]|uniref:High-affinity choline transporter 1 n=3 Tax=Rotaria magnacalcarata TaxID=392030 RepID=A0A816YBI5_9BILA|nr:unnamed protein product [Rotaria magnacalcarata]CAF2145816.1 unnamed protein product [Rotaria magnacalcarata]CAF2157176.1 unnamed protein product [Rotaria magnacalcarata]CAF3871047.1 unnamed protein product [Rotaria magnacalcarata]CAF3882286.1 unnamed protein product [Rotaria magnacalcarata]